MAEAAVLERIGIRPHRVVMAILVLGALALGALLLPGERERVAMLERDGKNREALSILERRFAEGDRSQLTIYQLQELNLHFGDLDRSRRMLELLARERPRDAEVQRRLAAFYKQTQDEDAYVKALEARISLRYSEAGCRELIGLLRRRGDFDGEQRALQDCRQRGYRRAEDLVRLATLHAASGEMGPASQILRSVDDLRRLKSDRERLTLFATLLEADQPREAQRRAVRWLKGARDDDFALTLIEMLADRKRHDFAIALAREVGEPGSSVSLAVAELMLDRGEIVAARTYLRGWLTGAKFDNDVLLSRFVGAALDAEDPVLAFEAAERFGLDRAPPADTMALAEALTVIGDQPRFDNVRAVLSAEQLARNPLLSAAIELRKGTTEQSRSLLSQVRVNELDEWRLALWARLMEQTGRSASTSAALREAGAVAEPGTIAHKGPVIHRTLPRIKRAARLRIKRSAKPVAAAPAPAISPAPIPFPKSGG